MSTAPLPNLYALLVGIGVYHSPNVPNLSSDADASAMKALLEDPMMRSQFGRMEILSLYNADATKANIVKGFQEHLSQAQAGDTALFFFGGHGVREHTEVRVFQVEETDGKITGIVCVDTEPTRQDDPASNSLSDKELRYLIRRLAHDAAGNPTAHVVTIFDCCHSGSASRYVPGEEPLPPNVRQLQRAALPSRSWAGFIFHDDPDVSAKIESGVELEEVLPQGDHIMLAACREVELAWERGDRGVFTSALLEVLGQNKGRISYHELNARVRNRMRFQFLETDEGNDQRQTPQLYVKSSDRGSRYQLFLTNQANDTPADGVIEYNEEEAEWRIDIGALHGVLGRSEPPQMVEVFEATAAKPSTHAQLLQVFPSHSTLQMPADFRRDASISYRGRIRGLGGAPFKVFVKGEGAGKNAAIAYIRQKLEGTSPAPFELVENEEAAIYTVIVRDSGYDIVQSFDDGRPRTKGFRRETKQNYMPFLVQIGRWTFLRDLEQTAVFQRNGKPQAQFPVSFRAFQLISEEKGTEIPLEPKGNQFTINLSPNHPVWSIRFEIRSHYHKDLYVGLAYMEHNFGVETNAAEDGIGYFRHIRDNPLRMSRAGAKDGGDVIHSSGTQNLANGKLYVRVGSGAYVASDNWEGYSDYIKLIVSEVDFDLESLDRKGLPRPRSDMEMQEPNRKRPKKLFHQSGKSKHLKYSC